MAPIFRNVDDVLREAQSLRSLLFLQWLKRRNRAKTAPHAAMHNVAVVCSRLNARVPTIAEAHFRTTGVFRLLLTVLHLEARDAPHGLVQVRTCGLPTLNSLERVRSETVGQATDTRSPPWPTRLPRRAFRSLLREVVERNAVHKRNITPYR